MICLISIVRSLFFTIAELRDSTEMSALSPRDGRVDDDLSSLPSLPGPFPPRSPNGRHDVHAHTPSSPPGREHSPVAANLAAFPLRTSLRRHSTTSQTYEPSEAPTGRRSSYGSKKVLAIGKYVTSSIRLREWEARISALPRQQRDRIPVVMDELMASMKIPQDIPNPLEALLKKVHDLFDSTDRERYVKEVAARLEERSRLRSDLEMQVVELHISGNPTAAKNRELVLLSDQIKAQEEQIEDKRKTIDREKVRIATLFHGLDLLLRRLATIKLEGEEADAAAVALRQAATGDEIPQGLLDLLVPAPSADASAAEGALSGIDASRLSFRTRSKTMHLPSASQKPLSRASSMHGPGERTPVSRTSVVFETPDASTSGLASSDLSFRQAIARTYADAIKLPPAHVKLAYLERKFELLLAALQAGAPLALRDGYDRRKQSKMSGRNKPRVAMSSFKGSSKKANEDTRPFSTEPSSAGYEEAADDYFLREIEDAALSTVAGYNRHMKDLLVQGRRRESLAYQKNSKAREKRASISSLEGQKPSAAQNAGRRAGGPPGAANRVYGRRSVTSPLTHGHSLPHIGAIDKRKAEAEGGSRFRAGSIKQNASQDSALKLPEEKAPGRMSAATVEISPLVLAQQKSMKIAEKYQLKAGKSLPTPRDH